MGMKCRRKNIKYGRYSRVLILPASLEKGESSTLAGNRLLLVDPRGEIDEGDLLEFLETYVEPKFWPWYQKRRGVWKRRRNHVSFAEVESEDILMPKG